MTATLVEIMQALADQLDVQLGSGGTSSPLIDGLQVTPLLTWNPTPPAIDVYPADPFQEPLGFGPGNNNLFLTVRARVDTPDHEGAQELLLSMMDPQAATSVGEAILSDQTLGGQVEDLAVTGPSQFGAFLDPNGNALLGCTWTVEVLP